MADSKLTLIAPDGREYVAQSEREAARLCRTQGYRAKRKPEPKPAEPKPAKTEDSK